MAAQIVQEVPFKPPPSAGDAMTTGEQDA